MKYKLIEGTIILVSLSLYLISQLVDYTFRTTSNGVVIDLNMGDIGNISMISFIILFLFFRHIMKEEIANSTRGENKMKNIHSNKNVTVCMLHNHNN